MIYEIVKETCYLDYGVIVHMPSHFCLEKLFSLQELSKITMPIVFNEPLSFLQRITEYMEHTYLIHKACTLSDSIERMQVSTARVSAALKKF